jgi:hypothetical protein
MNLYPESGAVVVYLPSASVNFREGDVERINSFAFYDVGKAFRQVEAFEGDIPTGAALMPLMDAQRAIGRLLEGKPIPLGVSRAKAETFNEQIRRVFER